MNCKNKVNLIALIFMCLIPWPRANAEAPAGAHPQQAAAADPSQVFTPLALPKEGLVGLAGGDKRLVRMGEVLAGLETVKLGAQDVHMFGNAPFAAFAEPSAVVIDAKKPQAVVKAAMVAEYVYVLFAALDLGKESPAQLTILRDDGVPTRVKWAPGEAIAECVGKMDGRLDPKEACGLETRIAFEGQAKDGTPVRFFITCWRNDNQWFPLTDLKFKLLEPKSRFVLLGVSVSNAKK